MQISVLKKLLQLISPKNSPEEEKSLEEILEQETESDEEMQNAVSSNKTVDNCFLRSECAETRSNGSEACPREQYDYVSRVRMQNSEPDVEMQNAECRMQNSEQDVEMQNAECRMQNNEDEKPPHTESNRSHLTSSVPRSAKAPQGILTKGELAEIRALFANLDDKEIQRLYKKVTK